jgi:UDP-N-acetylglucosamine--N-acetylmuramyl-(pentapeptide) pyrophosphoryl-undecaprenol N-acetylglucosamine transferase
MAPRVLIAAGGTAGHVVPALAVADALRGDGADVVFVGGERAEADLVPAAGYPFRSIRARGLSRSDPLEALKAGALAVAAVSEARKILKSERPDVVMGGGGYIAGPVGAAAVAMRIPLVLTEADSHLGLTNRMLARFAERVCLAFPIAGLDGDRYLVTGRPVPPPVTDRAGARERFDIPEGEDLVFVFGGSLGARSINLASLEAFRDAPFRVLHAAGKRDFASMDAPSPRYDLREYLDSAEFSAALSASDIVVARAGGSIFEVAAHGRPAVLVPYPHASADHQNANARWMADAGAATIIADSDLTGPRLALEVGELFADRSRMHAMGNASAALARPFAARDVAREIRAAAATRMG